MRRQFFRMDLWSRILIYLTAHNLHKFLVLQKVQKVVNFTIVTANYKYAYILITDNLPRFVDSIIVVNSLTFSSRLLLNGFER